MRQLIISESEGYDIDRIKQLLNTIGITYDVMSDSGKAATDDSTPDNSMVSVTMADGAQDQVIEPENIDKVEIYAPFVKAQLSTKNQMILRNVLAVLSSVAVVIAFVLEKLGIL